MFAPCAAPQAARGVARSNRASAAAAGMTAIREVVVARRQPRRWMSAAYRQFGAPHMREVRRRMPLALGPRGGPACRSSRRTPHPSVGRYICPLPGGVE
jgi:hypothetical protein